MKTLLIAQPMFVLNEKASYKKAANFLTYFPYFKQKNLCKENLLLSEILYTSINGGRGFISMF